MAWRRWVVGVALVGLASLLLMASVGLGGATPTRQSTLTITVIGDGAVVAHPGGRVCRRTCRRHFAADIRVRLVARPAAGSHLVRWSGACSGTRGCVVRLTRPRAVTTRFGPNRRNPPPSTLTSWNPHFRYCTPILTTIPFILGSQQNSLRGATEAGGGFQPHLRGPEEQHVLNPPCTVGRTGTFVEIHDVVVAADPDHPADGDEVVNMFDPSRPDLTDIHMKTIHTEIDHLLIANHVAPPIQPPKGTRVDIQGFIFWDPAHTTAQYHSYSGWEIHTLTAWRPAVGGHR